MLAFEAAKKENTYVFLGTGLGKTLVAELLIQWHILKSGRSRLPVCLCFGLVVALCASQTDICARLIFAWYTALEP